MSRKNIRQDSKIKTSLRLTMSFAVAATATFVGLLIIIFNLAKDEVSHAQFSSMFKYADCIQDTTDVLRGSINQKIMAVTVDITGKGNPFKINSITFNAKGTSLPISKNIENARLWFTATDPDFNLNQQVGSTVAKMDDDDFEIVCNQNLQPGKNYFWLTFDVKAEAATGPGIIDAQCMELKAGAVVYKPLVSNPRGKRFTQSNIPYYSTGNNVMNNAQAWNSKRDGSGVPPKQLTASRNSFFIQSGHHIVNSSPGNLQTVVVEQGGELRITSPLRLNTMNICCKGTVQMDAEVSDYYCFTEFSMDNGSNYIHNNTGYLPGLHCHFATRSNQIFYQYGAATLPYYTKWGNVLINTTSPINIDLQRNFNNVAGDFEIKSTGKDNYLFCGNSDTMNIGGNLVINGGRFMGMAGNNTGTLIINIENDLIVKEGCFYDAGIISSNKSGTILNIKGDVNLLGGAFDFNRSKDGVSLINVCNTAEPCRWMQKSTCDVTVGNICITPRAHMLMKGDKLGNIAKDRTLTVMSDAQLMCGNSVIAGDGEFVLQDKASLGIGSSQGINSEIQEGNIVTAKRTFHSGANYYYYMNNSPQSTGKFITSPKDNTVRSIILNKDKTSQVLYVAQPMNVMEQITINKGDIDQSKNKLMLPGMSDKENN